MRATLTDQLHEHEKELSSSPEVKSRSTLELAHSANMTSEDKWDIVAMIEHILCFVGNSDTISNEQPSESFPQIHSL